MTFSNVIPTLVVAVTARDKPFIVGFIARFSAALIVIVLSSYEIMFCDPVVLSATASSCTMYVVVEVSMILS